MTTSKTNLKPSPNSITLNTGSSNLALTVLGTRGSLPTINPETATYGGNTSCYLLETAGEAIIIDAGTGIANFPDTGNKSLHLFITHAHIDHILGLPTFLGSHQGKDISIYGETRDNLTIEQQLQTYMSPPLWPATMSLYNVNITFRAIDQSTPITIGDITITTMPSNHPGGSTIYKFTHKSTSSRSTTITLATDYEHSHESFDALTTFAQNSDLILYDAQYTPEEYEHCKGFGHSTYEQATKLQELTNPKKLILIHHAPNHSDTFLDELQKSLKPGIIIAREGLNIKFSNT